MNVAAPQRDVVDRAPVWQPPVPLALHRQDLLAIAEHLASEFDALPAESVVRTVRHCHAEMIAAHVQEISRQTLLVVSRARLLRLTLVRGRPDAGWSAPDEL